MYTFDNGMFTACCIMCKLWLECQTSPQVCIISNTHVILHVSDFIKWPVFSQWLGRIVWAVETPTTELPTS